MWQASILICCTLYGSVTAKPCSEGNHWQVFTKAICCKSGWKAHHSLCFTPDGAACLLCVILHGQLVC